MSTTREQVHFDSLTGEQRSLILRHAGRIKALAKQNGRMQFILIAFEGDKMLISASNHMVEADNR